MINNFLPVQIVFGAFLLFAVSRVLLRLKDGTLALNNFIFWSGLFILALIGVIRPELTSLAADKLGINRGSDVVVYASILLMFYLIFRTNILLENLRHDLTELVRKLALKK
ncbi:hypothetical protein COW80_03515 [Candidatus Beckwithbacteria bacterium CG22_combo_CG10-13_8_21_14_all_01_47_9]|uniref:DUF2304 domain-containing protein n=3 Tax=Candidatus Beckwithiibacteriota TaxID=1752726 RepID=A0A2H0E0S0_9BACT|nr:MAG: hypothetical protein COW80_03515 [Candidatus Beckwithbacteria bacterium CG22_combo_CG10-13_8_21_14_all_01_47_9]PJA22630.1 MAG: DUF2304 domain-containing protein [Candidatus Beckwithbacteria bacterium CG_4_10_14_0_2_um_filter_47_25]PJC65949.1 MAG: DUF2304 domain-containing protein [Candidatus Beckwithbacteria bacterium CG_4_9_14_0_2_um_filter_47_11]